MIFVEGYLQFYFLTVVRQLLILNLNFSIDRDLTVQIAVVKLSCAKRSVFFEVECDSCNLSHSFFSV